MQGLWLSWRAEKLPGKALPMDPGSGPRLGGRLALCGERLTSEQVSDPRSSALTAGWAIGTEDRGWRGRQPHCLVDAGSQ